ncbi:hypothetical protein ARMGADRAFT_1123913 [Armillaria gallica]|uniref:Uncharacterized protein n=1 Tax=Armillaria gallica TaxID=47427 RepID=A0A2H3DF04_ARMGA|nr:hypothetical protein ARMGADRAFT_1123913 [Armillaria gallica]
MHSPFLLRLIEQELGGTLLMAQGCLLMRAFGGGSDLQQQASALSLGQLNQSVLSHGINGIGPFSFKSWHIPSELERGDYDCTSYCSMHGGGRTCMQKHGQRICSTDSGTDSSLIWEQRICGEWACEEGHCDKRRLGDVDGLELVIRVSGGHGDVSRHYNQHQPRYRTGICQDEMWELWADVTSEGLGPYPFFISLQQYNSYRHQNIEAIFRLNWQTMLKPRRHTDNAGGGKIWRRKYFYSQRAVDVTHDLLPLFYVLSCILPVQHPPEPLMIPGKKDPGGPLWRRRVWRNYGAGQVLTRTSCMRGTEYSVTRNSTISTFLLLLPLIFNATGHLNNVYITYNQNTIDLMSKLAADVHTLGSRRRTGQQRQQTGMKENIVHRNRVGSMTDISAISHTERRVVLRVCGMVSVPQDPRLPSSLTVRPDSVYIEYLQAGPVLQADLSAAQSVAAIVGFELDKHPGRYLVSCGRSAMSQDHSHGAWVVFEDCQDHAWHTARCMA